MAGKMSWVKLAFASENFMTFGQCDKRSLGNESESAQKKHYCSFSAETQFH